MSSEADMVLVATAGRRPGKHGWIRVNCPLCASVVGKSDKRASLGVFPSSGYYHCFRCYSAGWTGERTGEEFAPPKEVVELAPPDGFVPLWVEPGRSAEALAPARRYLEARGIGFTTWQAASIGACLTGSAKKRIVVPLFDADSSGWFGWIGRDWTGNSWLRYLYPEGMIKSALLYHAGLLQQPGDAPLLVVEGVFDALPYYGNAVATLGKPGADQVDLLASSRRPLVIALDGDAWEESYALARRLNLRGVRAGFVRLPAGEDPGSVEPSWLLSEANRAI